MSMHGVVTWRVVGTCCGWLSMVVTALSGQMCAYLLHPRRLPSEQLTISSALQSTILSDCAHSAYIIKSSFSSQSSFARSLKSIGGRVFVL